MKKSDDIYLRIANMSSVTFSSVYISFPVDRAAFENKPKEETSEYRKILTAYRCGVEVFN